MKVSWPQRFKISELLSLQLHLESLTGVKTYTSFRRTHIFHILFCEILYLIGLVSHYNQANRVGAGGPWYSEKVLQMKSPSTCEFPPIRNNVTIS